MKSVVVKVLTVLSLSAMRVLAGDEQITFVDTQALPIPRLRITVWEIRNGSYPGDTQAHDLIDGILVITNAPSDYSLQVVSDGAIYDQSIMKSQIRMTNGVATVVLEKKGQIALHFIASDSSQPARLKLSYKKIGSPYKYSRGIRSYDGPAMVQGLDAGAYQLEIRASGTESTQILWAVDSIDVQAGQTTDVQAIEIKE